MPRKSETKPEFNQFFELPNNSLRSYFGSVVKGQPEVYETPFAKGESTKHMLSAWMEELVSINDRWPSLWKFENDLAKKVGPMSVRLPLRDRMHDIEHYYEGILLPSTPISKFAVNAVIREWNQARGLRLRSQSDTVRLMKKSTNSGSPFFIKRRLALSKTMPVLGVHMIDDYVHQYLNNGYSNWEACAILGWRGQEGGYSKDDVKQRVVWMFPFGVNIEELRVYQPLIEAAQKFDIVPAWISMDKVDEHITALFDTKSDSDLIVCTDFTKFDQHFNPVMQLAAKTILSAILTPNYDSKRWLENVFSVKYMIPLAYNYGEIKYGQHGMASGSGGTNADETLSHRALQHEVAGVKGRTILNPHSMCLGDDGILSYPGIDIDDVTEMYSSHGLDMNPDKQEASTQDCVYLRRWHHKNYRIDGICAGVYSTCRALGRLRYLERFMNPEYWDEKAVALRQLSILENVKFHPMKEQFVKFCMKRDKYRLGIDIPHFLDNVKGIAKEKIDYMPDFLGYTKTLQSQGDELGGIENWWIVKYLKSLS